MKITLNGKELKMAQPQQILDIINDENRNFVCAKVNNRIFGLDHVPEDGDVVELLDLNDVRAVKLYVSALRYVIAMACKKLWPKARSIFNYSVSRSIFCTLGNLSHPFSMENFERLQKEVNKIISNDIKINRKNVTKAEAREIFLRQKFADKIKILDEITVDIPITLYECNGYYDYMYDFMLPSTGYLKKYTLKYYSPGFLIFYPRSECSGEIPTYEEEKVFRDVLREANYWNNILKVETISKINQKVRNGEALELINICETRHNDQISTMGRQIFENVERIRLICVAGPSSSGKTTFTNRLKIELLARGIKPLMISMDNFYHVDPKKFVLDEDGKPDFEHINALDLKLFDETIYKLIKGEAMPLPIFDFATKTRSFTNPVKITNRQPILIEGIHGLNDLICPSITDNQKFKIFIAPLAQYRIDDHTPISLSDMRLIRRIVRDKQFRNTSCEHTIAMWQQVRKGEFKWIYKYQNQADAVFNSELAYEPLALAKYAIPALKEITKESQYYIVSSRLLSLLEYYESITDKWIPCNSILREFIGDSIFYTDDKR